MSIKFALQTSYMDAFGIAIQTLTEPLNFLLVVLGTLLGLTLGIIPGIGGAVGIALLIPLTYTLEPIVAFMLFASVLGGANFGGSVTAILINTPGMPPNAATIIDGYPMTRDGRSNEALGASATASALGAIFGVIFLALTIPIVIQLLLLFGPPEIFWLSLWGLAAVSVVVRGAVTSGLLSAALGFMIAAHGVNYLTATWRWTYGWSALADGFHIIAVIIGVFAIAEMINLVATSTTIEDTKEEIRSTGGSTLKGVKAVFNHKKLFFQSALIGVITGTIPGIGGTAANYFSYLAAAETQPNNESFGTGDVRGVIASEASNDAKDGGSFLPTLGFGIPGSTSMAILLGAFVLHGITPGPQLMNNNLGIVAIIILSLLISNILTSTIGLLTAEQLTRVTRIDVRKIAPAVIAIGFLGTFMLSADPFDMATALIFGIFGFMMIKVNMSRVPLILGIVLAQPIEQSFFQSVQLSRGEIGIFFDSAISIIIIIMLLLTLFLPYVKPAFNRIRPGVKG